MLLIGEYDTNDVQIEPTKMEVPYMSFEVFRFRDRFLPALHLEANQSQSAHIERVQLQHQRGYRVTRINIVGELGDDWYPSTSSRD